MQVSQTGFMGLRQPEAHKSHVLVHFFEAQLHVMQHMQQPMHTNGP